MDAILDFLRSPPAAALLTLLGMGWTVHGFRLGVGACAPGLGGLPRAMLLARGLRTSILGLCSIAAVAGAAAGSASVVGLACIIAGEELLEITTVVAALRWGEEHGL